MHAEWIAPLEGERLLLWLTSKLNEGVMKNSSPLIRLIIKPLHECRLKRDRKRERERKGGSLNYKSLNLTHSQQSSSFVPLETDVRG